TDETVTCEGPIVAGPSLAEWAEGIRPGEVAAPPAATERPPLTEPIRATDFAARRGQAAYLESCFGQVLPPLPEPAPGPVHRSRPKTVAGMAPRTTGTAVHPPRAGGPVPAGKGAGSSDSVPDPAVSRTEPDDVRSDERGSAGGHGDEHVGASRPRHGWTVELEGRAPLAADLLLLAAGHTDSRPAAASHELAAFARRHGAVYLPPAQASDAPLDLLAPREDVIVRGMGLAFIDLMALLTQGRGGSFTPDPRPGEPGRLRYHPSGQEPRLWVGSRRGVPYHSKVRDEGAPTGLGPLEHVT